MMPFLFRESDEKVTGTALDPDLIIRRLLDNHCLFTTFRTMQMVEIHGDKKED